MKRVDLKTCGFVPKAFVMPRRLRKLPPFNQLVYCERTYSNDYASNTWAIVCLLRRKPLATTLGHDVCHSVVYAGSTVQSVCLVIKTAFSPAFWVSVVRDAKHEFKLRK